MSNELIRSRVADYYSRKLAEHGASPRGVDWNSAESQDLRFAQIVRLMDRGRPVSVNDFGCGYGALAGYLRDLGVEADVHGFDLSEAMVAAARDRYPEQRWTGDPAELAPADYTVCSGIFNVKLDVEEADWVAYVWETLDQMHALSRQGTIFNMLTGRSDRERMRADLYYGDPGEWLEACMSRYGRDAALLHDYPLYEFTLLIGSSGR
jgi:SAM-dependent methyltransferase